MVLLILFAVFWLAWSNGANDNFKGVATLYGCGTASFRAAIAWATLATLAGSLVSVIAAGALMKSFSGSGIVQEKLVNPSLLAAVGGAGAITILLATFLGMPTSTTHALTGALVGAALATGSSHIDWPALADRFIQPLLLSPVLALLGTVLLYPLFRKMRLALGVRRDSCLCISGGGPQPVPALNGDLTRLFPVGPAPHLGRIHTCSELYRGQVMGVSAQGLVDTIHYLSAGAVCFARAVNDTPKIAALFLATGGQIVSWKLGLVAAAMAFGGLLHSRKVAQTMANRITELNPGQGLTANLVTAGLVLGASAASLPVSTTHVSCGSIFGIGLLRRRKNWKTIAQILVTWLTTFPLGSALGAILYWAITRSGI